MKIKSPWCWFQEQQPPQFISLPSTTLELHHLSSLCFSATTPGISLTYNRSTFTLTIVSHSLNTALSTRPFSLFLRLYFPTSLLYPVSGSTPSGWLLRDRIDVWSLEEVATTGRWIELIQISGAISHPPTHPQTKTGQTPGSLTWFIIYYYLLIGLHNAHWWMVLVMKKKLLTGIRVVA